MHFVVGPTACIFWFCHLTAVWTNYLTSLNLGFVVYKIENIIVPPFMDYCEDIHLFIHSVDTSLSSYFMLALFWSQR